jgi:quercetin dioxygenase-like cupin family protein
MKVLSHGPEARQERPATEILHDEADTRVVAFHLLPGQQIPPHRSRSTVMVQVTAGSGTFHGDDGGVRLGMGESAIFSPNEVHAIDAGDEPLRFIAILTPRPQG